MQRTSHKDFILYAHNLTGYDPTKPEAFQWPIDSSCMTELVTYMKDDEFINGHLILNGQPTREGTIKHVEGMLYFQLKLNEQVAASVVPPVPDHVRRAALERENSRSD